MINGRPSIPPERLLIALYSVRSERLFCEMLDYHLLFRWFLEGVVKLCREQQLLSDEHFSVDGALITCGRATP